MYSGNNIVLIKKNPLMVFEELVATMSKRFKEKGITQKDIIKEIKAIRNRRD